MTRIARAEVERIAELARLDLAADEADRMTAELEAILGYVEALDGLDTTGVAPTVHALRSDDSEGQALRAMLPTPLRDDRALPPLAPERALANAPDAADFAFVVPKVLDEDEA